MDKSKPLPIPSYLKHRPRCNSYPSPPDVKFINKIKRPKLQLDSCPENKKSKNTEKSPRKSF